MPNWFDVKKGTSSEPIKTINTTPDGSRTTVTTLPVERENKSVGYAYKLTDQVREMNRRAWNGFQSQYTTGDAALDYLITQGARKLDADVGNLMPQQAWNLAHNLLFTPEADQQWNGGNQMDMSDEEKAKKNMEFYDALIQKNRGITQYYGMDDAERLHVLKGMNQTRENANRELTDYAFDNAYRTGADNAAFGDGNVNVYDRLKRIYGNYANASDNPDEVMGFLNSIAFTDPDRFANDPRASTTDDIITYSNLCLGLAEEYYEDGNNEIGDQLDEIGRAIMTAEFWLNGGSADTIKYVNNLLIGRPDTKGLIEGWHSQNWEAEWLAQSLSGKYAEADQWLADNYKSLGDSNSASRYSDRAYSTQYWNDFQKANPEYRNAVIPDRAFGEDEVDEYVWENMTDDPRNSYSIIDYLNNTLTKDDSQLTDDDYDYIMRFGSSSSEEQVMQWAWSHGMLTDEEKQMYTTLKSKGRDASKYYDEVLTYKLAPAYEQWLQQQGANANGWLKTANFVSRIPANIIGGPISAISLAAQNIRKADTGKPVDYYGNGMTTSNYANRVTAQLTNGVESDVGKFFMSMGVSTADSIAAMLLGWGATGAMGLTGKTATAVASKISGSIVALGAGASYVYDAAAEGNLTDTQIALGFLTSSINEALWESWSIGNFFEFADTPVVFRNLKKTIGDILLQSGINGSEELATELSNVICEYAIGGKDSQYAASYDFYTKPASEGGLGMSEADAVNAIAGEVFWRATEATAGGVVQGLFMGGGEAGLQILSDPKQFRIARDVMKNKGFDATYYATMASTHDASQSRLNAMMKVAKDYAEKNGVKLTTDQLANMVDLCNSGAAGAALFSAGESSDLNATGNEKIADLPKKFRKGAATAIAAADVRADEAAAKYNSNMDKQYSTEEYQKAVTDLQNEYEAGSPVVQARKEAEAEKQAEEERKAELNRFTAEEEEAMNDAAAKGRGRDATLDKMLKGKSQQERDEAYDAWAQRTGATRESSMPADDVSTPAAEKAAPVTGNATLDGVIRKARQKAAEGGTLSGQDVRAVLADPEALNALQEKTGDLGLSRKTNAEKRAIIKGAIARLAETGDNTGAVTGQAGSVDAESYAAMLAEDKDKQQGTNINTQRAAEGEAETVQPGEMTPDEYAGKLAEAENGVGVEQEGTVPAEQNAGEAEQSLGEMTPEEYTERMKEDEGKKEEKNPPLRKADAQVTADDGTVSETTGEGENTNLGEEEQKAPSGNAAVDATEKLVSLSKKYGDRAEDYLNGYEAGQDVEKYDSAMNAAISYGQSAVPLESIQNAQSVSYLSDTQLQAAWQMGRDMGYRNLIESSAANLYGTRTGERKVGTVVLESGIKAENLNKQQKLASRYFRFMSEATGVNVVLYESQTDENGNYVGESGRYNRNTPGTIYVDINAGLLNQMDGKRLANYAMVQTFGHEFTHFVENWNPEGYAEFREAVFEELGKRGIDVDYLIREQMKKTGLGREAASHEVIAESMMGIMKDSKFAEKMATEHQNVFQKFVERLKEFLKTVTDYFKHSDMNRYAGEYFLKDNINGELKYMQSIVDMYDRIATQAVENYQNADVEAGDRKAMSPGNDIQMSIRSTSSALGVDAYRDQNSVITFKVGGKPVTHVTAEHIKNNSGIGLLIKTAVANSFVSESEAEKQYTAAADLMNTIMKTNDPELTWAWAGASIFSALKENSDGQYGTTIDFTTVCRKTQEMVTAMSAAMKKRHEGLTKKQVTELQYEVSQSGGEVPCPVCYVFSRWAGIGGMLDNIRDLQDKYEKMGVDEVAKRTAELEKQIIDHGWASKKKNKYQVTAEGTEKLMQEKQGTLDGYQFELEKLEKKGQDTERQEELRKMIKDLSFEIDVLGEWTWAKNIVSRPDYKKVPLDILYDLNAGKKFAEEYAAVWKYRTTRGPSSGKAIMPYSDMRLGDIIIGAKAANDYVARGNRGLFTDKDGNVIAKGKATKDQLTAIRNAIKRTSAQNLIGGQRFQSTSDFRYEYALDYIQAFWELQAIGSKLQTYTKVVEYADIIAAIGGDVNLSVMPLGKGIKDGKLVYSSVTGMKIEAALEANRKFDNAQLILVGINDDHIMAALDDFSGTGGEYVGFVIPYHASGASIQDFISELVKNLGESFVKDYYQDYSTVQTDKDLDTITKAQEHLQDIRKTILTGKGKITAADLDLIRGKSVSIVGRSFEDLRAVEEAALAGDKAAMKEYLSWSAGILSDLYDKMTTGSEKGTRLSAKQADMIMPHEYWNKSTTRSNAYVNGFIFRSYCAALGLKPRFSGSAGKSKFGDFTGSTGYWKTLIDRPMYNNDGTYRDQTRINVTNFDNEMLKSDYAEKTYPEYKIQEPNEERAARVGAAYADRISEAAETNGTGDEGATQKSTRIDYGPRLDELNKAVKEGKVHYTYKAMSFWGYDEDGNAILRSPMAEVVDGKLSDAYLMPPKESGKLNWYQATEDPSQLLIKYQKPGNKTESYISAADNPDLIAEDWSNLYFKLVRKNVDTGKSETVYARYNPYEHSSDSMMNDQFKGAYKRPNLVTVKMAVPMSEQGAYRAQYSKDSTGWTEWKSGDVMSAIRAQKDLQRNVFLSRYAAPVEIISDSEVARNYKEYLDGTTVKIPDNVVSPSLLKELEKIGVPIERTGKVEKYAAELEERRDNEASKAEAKRAKNGNNNGGVQYEIRFPRYTEEDIINNAIALQKMEPVDHISGTELGDMSIPTETRVRNFIESFGGNIFSERFGDIKVNNASFHSEYKHGSTPVKIETYGAIPSVIHNGQVIYNIHKNEQGTERIIVAAPVTVGEKKEKYYVGVMLQRHPQSQRFYLHDAVTEKEVADFAFGSLSPTGAMSENNKLHTTDILLRALNVNSENANEYLNIQKQGRGNGYDGYSMSNNARDAYRNGEMPLSKWSKGDILSAINEVNESIDCSALNVNTLRERFLKNTSWHHTSMYYNATNFYGLDEDYVKGLTQDDVDKIAKNQKPVTKASRDSSNDERIDEAYRKAQVIVASGMLKTEKSVMKRIMSGKSVDDAYSKALELIRKNDSARVDNWRKLPADHWRREYVDLYDNDFEAYVNKMYANEKLSRNSNEFKAMNDYYGKTGNDGVQMQQRTAPLTYREILAIAENSDEYLDLSLAERDALKIYKGKLSKLQELTDRRTEEGRKWKDLTFGENRNAEEAQKTKNRMKELDRQISNASGAIEQLENEKMMKRVIQSVRSAAEKSTRAQWVDRMTRYKDHRDNAEAVAKYKKSIAATTKKLYEMVVVNSDKKHVPDALRVPLAQFLETIDFSSKRSISGGEATKNDAKYARMLGRIKDVLQNQINYMNNPENGNSNMDQYIDLPQGFVDAIQEHLDNFNKAINDFDDSNTHVNLMTSKELEALDYILHVLNTSINKINVLHTAGRFSGISEAAEDTMSELAEADEDSGKFENLRGFYGWKNTLPYYAFKRFGRAGQQIFTGLQDGWDKLAFNARDVINFAAETYTAKQAKKWSRTVHTMVLESGETVQMTTAQIMSLWCLSQREQAKGHIYGGGIRVGNIDFKDGLKATHIHKTNHYAVTEADVNNILSLLGPEEIKVATELQNYMNRVGSEWGNAVSMERFGYRAFGEKNYFPITTDSTDHPAVDPEARANDMFRLLNLSMTKALTPNANNALVVGDIFSVFANHMSDMAKYNALALPLLDAIKWYNYKTKSKNEENGQISTESVQRAFERAFGKEGPSYFINFMKDMNGANNGGRDEGMVNAMMSRYKVAAVAANLRVALLQPTAYVRASAVISPKSMIKAMGMKGGTQEMLEHSGIGVWKDLGYFDTNIGSSMEQQIMHTDTFRDKVNEKALYFAELGDKLTWGRIWNACKVECQSKGVKNEELMTETAKLFRDVIYRTQVVDSTMTRTQLMRNKSALLKNITGFMSEPSLSYNLLMDAYHTWKKDADRLGKGAAWAKNKSIITRALTAYAASQIASAIVESIADALRNDDDYKDFIDKWCEAMFGKDGESILSSNLVSDIDVLGKLPIIKDALSILSGYDSADMSMQWIQDLLDLPSVWDSGKPIYGKIYKSLQAVSSTVGLPLSNAMREAKVMFNNTIGTITGDKLKTYEPPVKTTIREAYEGGYLSKEEAVSEMVRRGAADDEKAADKIVSKWEGQLETGIDFATMNDLKSRYVSGDVDSDTAKDYLVQYYGKDESSAKDQMAVWDFVKENEAYSDITMSAARNYNTYLTGSNGISRDDYYRYWTDISNIQGDDKDHDGKTDTGTLTGNKLKYISQLSLTGKQKMNLALAMGIKESTIKKQYPNW